MARVNRTRGFRVSASKQISTETALDQTSKKRRRRSYSPASPFKGLEALESRLMLTVTPSIIGGVLTCTGTTGETNTITVALTNSGNSMVATVDGVSATFNTSKVNALIINAGSRADSIKVDSQIKGEESLTEGHGAAPTATTPAAPTVSTGTSTPSSGSSNTSSNTKAGIMFKQSATAGAPYFLISTGPAGDIKVQYDFNGSIGEGTYSFPNVWMKVTRLGNTLSAFLSSDGVTWTDVFRKTLTMTACATVGLFECSHKTGVLGTATFDNVSYTPGL